MNTNYTIKNFRVFDEKGATFQMAPLTILTGCNSSGKSSVTKSLMLLNPVMQSIKQDIQSGKLDLFNYFWNRNRRYTHAFNGYVIDFTKGNHNIGNFEGVINWNSSKDSFSIRYSVDSNILCEPVDVEMVWSSCDERRTGQSLKACLKSVTISVAKNVLYEVKEYCGDFKFALGKFKDTLIRTQHNIELGYLVKHINNEESISKSGQCINFTSLSRKRAKNFLGKNIYCRLLNAYITFDKVLEQKSLRYLSNLDNFNLIFSKGNKDIDWEKSDIPLRYFHLLSLKNLMLELDCQDKDSIMSYAKKRFIKDVRGLWFNTPKYRRRISQIFSAFIGSEFDRFSEFYEHLESEFEISGFLASVWGYHLLPCGTASKYYEMNLDHEWDTVDMSWNKLSKCSKYELIFKCLQFFAGYEIDDDTYYRTPLKTVSPESIETMFLIMESICIDALSSSQLMTDIEFVEMDRSNVRRIYTYGGQETSFNRVLEDYINMESHISYKSHTKLLKNDLRTDEYGEEYSLSKYKKGLFSSNWLKKMSDIDGFEIKRAPEGVGNYVYITKRKSNGDIKKVTLADVGYGTTPLVVMLMRIEIMICTYLNRKERVTICIEEPESNMHPSLQSLLADMFVDAITNYPVNFIIETHSEYLIRKLQVLVAKGIVSKDKISLYYLNNPAVDNDKMPQVNYIPISSDGQLLSEFGTGFFDESINSYNLLNND